MNSTIICALCEHKTNIFEILNDRDYHKCPNCHGIQMNPCHYLTLENEKKRYLEHKNDVTDIRYQNFVSPIVNSVIENFEISHSGLDFVAGTGPVITKMLNDKGYLLEKYDPFFWNNKEVLEKKYDYIVCCEVIEHFHFPHKEFKLLKSLLKENGMLFIMTDLYSETINFKDWYYKNDLTHVFFYHEKTLQWISNHFNLRVHIKNRLITFANCL